jgi:hypothetical protein
VFDISAFTDEQIDTAYQRMIELLDMRILPDPLQDDLYIFSVKLAQTARERRESAGVKEHPAAKK